MIRLIEQKREERPVYSPPVDIRETEDGLVLTADLPGVDQRGLEVFVEDNMLWIHGRFSPEPPAGFRAVRMEIPPCDFVRSFILSDDVDPDGIRAELSRGVLTLVMPKAPRYQRRQVQVNAGD